MRVEPTEPDVEIGQAAASRSTTEAREIGIAWGPNGLMQLTLPAAGLLAGADLDVFRPDLSDPPADYPSALEHALDSPVGAARLEHLLVPGTSVAIVVDDPSRWTPVREALPIVLHRLRAIGLAAQDVTICVGVGRHAAVDDESMRRRVGESIAATYRCFSPPVDDLSAYADLGQTPQGVPVRVFRPVAEASLRILIGSVLPHLQAGFGGGYKLILPGASHRSTLGALHRQGIDAGGRTTRLLGDDTGGNPMRRAIHAAAERLGPCWSISHIVGRRGQVLQIATGHPEQVQDLLSAEARRRFQASSAPPADLVVVANDPWPGDPMQSFKVLLHHRAACRPGGVLAGFFWTDPTEIGRSFRTDLLRLITATGGWGAWTIRRLLPVAQRIAAATSMPAAFMLHWARELVVDRTVLVYAPALHERVGRRLGPIPLFADQAALWQAAAMALERRGRIGTAHLPRIRVFPQGGLTYVPQGE
jgi:hypothetical protein